MFTNKVIKEYRLFSYHLKPLMFKLRQQFHSIIIASGGKSFSKTTLPVLSL
jgi:hypothetical protein